MRRTNKNKVVTEHLVWQDRNDGRVAKVFVHNVSRRNKRGSLYIVTEVSCPSQDGDTLINTIVPAVVKGYTDSQESHEVALEDAITRANIVLKNMEHETTSTWFGNLHMVIGLLAGQKLYFSTIGNPEVLLMRNGKIGGITKTAKEESTLYFKNVSSGELVEEDNILVYTPGLLEIFPLENLMRIIEQYEGFPASKFELLLEENRGRVNALFALVSFRCKKRSGQIASDQAPLIRSAKNSLIRTPFDALSHIIKTLLTAVKNITGVSLSIVQKANIGFPVLNHNIQKKQISHPWRALAVILILSLLVGVWNIFRDHGTETADMSVLVDETQKKIEAAENALIFNDKGLASKNILDARLLLARVSQSDTDSVEVNNLKKATEELEDKIFGTVIVEDPKLVWEIKNNLGSPPTDLFISGNKFFAYNETQLVIYSKGDVEKLIFLPVSSRSSLAPGIFMKPQNRFFIYASENGMLSFNPVTEKYEDIGSALAVPENFDTLDISYYHDYVYLLGSGDTIIKYLLANNGLQYIGEWFEEPIPLSSITSFAVDGSIYVAGKGGTILKLANGKVLQEWKIPVDPSEIKISASEDLDYLYIIDMAGSSILKLSKDGEILNNYKSSKFKKLNDIFIDEEQNRMYVLDGFNVYEINI